MSAPGRQKLYFVNAPVDVAVIGGASILSYLLLRAFHTGMREEWTWTVSGLLVWAVNWPHFSATSYRLYHSRRNVEQYLFTALLIPVLVLCGVLASFAWPATIAPYFVKIFLIWSPYHFSGQTLGISLLYARRAGLQIGKLERLALSSFIYGTYFTTTMRSETGILGSSYYGIKYPNFGLPVWSVTVAQTLMYAGGAAFLFFVARWSLRDKRTVPPIVLLPAATQYVWFVLGNQWPSFNEFVPFFHSLQYLLIAWSMQLKERLDLGGFRPSRAFVLSESARWGAVNFVGGAFLFWMLPRIFNWGLGGQSLAFATGIALAGVQIHHFFVDGVIWKLRAQTVGNPLMMNFQELVEERPRELVTA